MPSLRLRSVPPLLAAVVLLVPLLLMSLSAGAAPDPNKSQELREAIEGASAEEVLAVQQYQDARAQRLELDSKVAALDAQLSAASETLRAAEAELAKIQTKIDAAQVEVDRIQGEIDESKHLLQESAVNLYKNAGGGSLPLLTSSGTAHELISEAKYNTENVRRLERELLRQAGLRDELADARDDLKKEGAKAEEAEQVAQTERDRVGGLRADTDTQRQQAATAEQQEQDVLAAARAKKAQYENELAAEQARIQAALSPGGSAGLSSGGGSGEVAWPLRGPVSSGFGNRQDPFGNGVRMHTGIDIVASSGTPIAAGRAGTVASAGWNGGYGNCVIIDHGDGLATLYGHQSKIAVSAGQKVSQGETIGYVGSTGNSTGPHLHFEVRVNGNPQNPLNYLP